MESCPFYEILSMESWISSANSTSFRLEDTEKVDARPKYRALAGDMRQIAF